MLAKLKPGETKAESLGSLIVPGLVANAHAARTWSNPPLNVEADANTVVRNLEAAAERVNRGDLSHAEATLNAQAATLNAVFTTLAIRAHHSNLMDHLERYMRLAFKAQSQCRATYETLAEMKNPPVFTRQANIAGQQVVNNGTVVGASRAREIEPARNELQEAHGERVAFFRTLEQVIGEPPAVRT